MGRGKGWINWEEREEGEGDIWVERDGYGKYGEMRRMGKIFVGKGWRNLRKNNAMDCRGTRRSR
jgi:hypothetical protein